MMGTNVKIHIVFNTSCVKMLKIHDSQHFFRIKICGAKKAPNFAPFLIAKFIVLLFKS